MSIFDRLAWRMRSVDARRREAREVTQEIANQIHLSPLCSDYENMFAQVRPLINDMIAVRPFGVGRNGAKLPMRKTPELALLNDPNEEMSWADFADLMFATWLTEDELNIHVHLDDRKNVIGYSIIPPFSKYYLNNEPYWQVYVDNELVQLTRDEVATIYFSRSPRNPHKGVSPATSARTAAQLDDLAMQYEKAYFENGAIPATITFITASSREKFEEKRRELESGLKGARNRNKTVFLWRAYQPETNETRDEVEVKTIQAPNNTLAIKDIVSIINDRLNKAVGVSNFILGDDSSAKYDNAELSDHQFVKRRVYPALISFWSQFQHELDRIVDGLGYAIQFELEIPELTDRAKTQAETNSKNVNSLLQLIDSGALPTSAVYALGLSDNWLPLAKNLYAKRIVDDAEQRKLDAKLADAKADTHKAEHACCHAVDAVTYKPFTNAEKNAKLVFERLMSLARAIMIERKEVDLDELEMEIAKILRDEALIGGKFALEALEELIDNEDISQALQAQIERGITISEGLEKRFAERTKELVEDFAGEARELLRETLMNSEALTANELRKRLEELMPASRAATIARNETVYAFRSGSLEHDEQAAKDLNLRIEITWHAHLDDRTCNTCAAMDGQTTILGDKFTNSIHLDDGVVLPNGKIVGYPPEDATPEERKKYTNTNDFAVTQDMWNDDGRIPQAHVNCRCFYTKQVLIGEGE